MSINTKVNGSLATVAMDSCNFTGAPDWCAQWFCQPIGTQIHVERIAGNGNIDTIRTNRRGSSTKIRQKNTGIFVNQLKERLYICFWHNELFEILVVIFEIQPVVLSSPVDWIRCTHPVGKSILCRKRF